MKKKDFLSIIWGYSPHMYNFAPEENYHLHALKIAKDMGLKPVAIVWPNGNNMRKDPHLDQDIKILDYKNFFYYLFQIIKHNFDGATIYANSYEWKSFIVPFIARKTVFAPHTQPKRQTETKQFIQDFVYNRFKKVRVINQTEYNFVKSRGVKTDKLVIAPITVSSSIFYKTGNNERDNIVYFGNITPKKNLLTILKAIREIKVAGQKINLDVIGNNWDENFLENIKKLEIEDRVNYLGFVDEKELARKLNNYSIYVNSSFDEGQCVAVYDAALCGCALCLPNIMSFNEVFGSSALFHEVNDYKKLANNILYYLNNKKLIEEHNKKNIDMILKDYSISSVEEKTKKLFTI